jgi:hypothetical protein
MKLILNLDQIHQFLLTQTRASKLIANYSRVLGLHVHNHRIRGDPAAKQSSKIRFHSS